MSVVETAKQIRQELKAAFPGVKFSVRSKSYSMGQSVTVSWTDGPTTKEVQEIASNHEIVHRDAYGDILSGGNTYIHVSRTHSPELEAWAEGILNSQSFGWDICEWEWSCMIRKVCELDSPYLASEIEYPETVETLTEDTSVELMEESEDIMQGVEAVEVKPYFVHAKFGRSNKQCNISRYMEQIQHSSEYTEERVKVCYEAKLTPAQWNYFVDGGLLDSFDWLADKGGTSSTYKPGISLVEFSNMDTQEKAEWIRNSFNDDCVLVKCGWLQIVVNPQGYNYARYVGLDVQKDNLVQLVA